MKNDDVKKRSEEVALFRFGVIGDLVHLPPGAKGLYARLREKAAIDYRIPGSTRVRVAEETIRDWLKAYRKGGLDALTPKPRADHGQSRALPRELADTLVCIKDEKPDLSVQLVIREALAHHPPTGPGAGSARGHGVAPWSAPLQGRHQGDAT